MLDSTCTVETPEGVELPVIPAGISVRGLAFLTDLTVRVVLYLAFITVVTLISPAISPGLILIMYFLLEWFYPVTFEVLMDGATPGKRMLNLKVINDDGTPVGFTASLIRNLLIIADFLPSFFIGGIVCMQLDNRFRRLGDLAAGTLVVHLEPKKKLPPMPDDRTVRQPPFPLAPEDQKAFVSYAERRTTLSDARALELASILAPVLVNADAAADTQVLQVANGLMGRS